MIKHILYATDLGLYGPYIMKQVAILAQSTGARVDILHVIEPMGLFAESIIDAYMPEQERKYLRDQGLTEVIELIRLQVIDTLKSEYSDALKTINLSEVLVEVGQVAKVIVEQTQLRNSDLIALGGCSRQPYGGGITGSVVNKVLQLAPIPIYIIPMVNLEGLARK